MEKKQIIMNSVDLMGKSKCKNIEVMSFQATVPILSAQHTQAVAITIITVDSGSSPLVTLILQY